MIEKFITIDNQILMACTGDEIKIVRMDGNPIIIQGYNHMIQSQSRSGRLMLKISGNLFEIIGRQYMSGIGLNWRRSSEYLNLPFPPAPSIIFSELAIGTTPPIHFELAIVEGDPTDRATWKPQVKWEGCVIDEDELEPHRSLSNDELIMHTLPIDFANM